MSNLMCNYPILLLPAYIHIYIYYSIKVWGTELLEAGFVRERETMRNVSLFKCTLMSEQQPSHHKAVYLSLSGSPNM